MPENLLSRKISFLSDPRRYPEAPASVSKIETHFSWLFLTDRYVYKLKKPQRQLGMDYRSVSARLRGCREELRLNKRLARSVYLEVIPLSVDHRGELCFGHGQRTEDWLVKMTRLPSRYMLDQALANGRVTHRRLSVLAATLGTFYAEATPCRFTASQYLTRLQRQVSGNKHGLAEAYPQVSREAVETAVDRQLAFIARNRRALGFRGARVVEAHGDLRPEHICVAHPVCVIDCLEFNRDLRLLDPAEEIAFLALEIHRLRHPHIARDLIARYRRLSGDLVSDSLIHFYMSRRALTRAMLAAKHLADPQISDRARWVDRTHSYLEDACEHGGMALELAGEFREPYSFAGTGQRVSSGMRGFPSSMRRRA